MTDRSATKLALWPFVFVDILFLGLAGVIFSLAHRPLQFWEASALIACAGIGAWSFLTPFLRRYAAEVKFADSDYLTDSVAQIKNLDQIAAQLSSATNHLKTAQDDSKQTMVAAKGISEKMGEESRAFAEFIQKANDVEKNHLRLEVEKLRRSEGEWLQILVHILDHIFALNQAAVRSGKLSVAEQIGGFQNVCRDTVRRMGLVCHSPDAQTIFDEKFHQLSDETVKPENGSRLSETLAAGYSYQGRVIRRALVRLQTEVSPKISPVEASASEMVETVVQKPLF